ncbi:hypothetical protein [Paenibacillus sp.]
MKTIKWLKASIFLQIIYAFFCIFSTICFAINHHWGIYNFFSLGMLSAYGWIINPTGILTIVLGLSFYFSEKGKENAEKIIGRKWAWFVWFFIIDTLLYITCGGLMVIFTGGV